MVVTAPFAAVVESGDTTEESVDEPQPASAINAAGAINHRARAISTQTIAHPPRFPVPRCRALEVTRAA